MNCTRIAGLATIVTLVLAACSNSEDASSEQQERRREESDAPAAAGRVIEIKAITDATGNRYEPAEIEAHQGDILRFTLVSGVHNLHFLPDSNPAVTGLPPATDMLQLPGQTVDIPLTVAPGHYYFQCDPHAALGMTGKLEIED